MAAQACFLLPASDELLTEAKLEFPVRGHGVEQGLGPWRGEGERQEEDKGRGKERKEGGRGGEEGREGVVSLFPLSRVEPEVLERRTPR